MRAVIDILVLLAAFQVTISPIHALPAYELGSINSTLTATRDTLPDSQPGLANSIKLYKRAGGGSSSSSSVFRPDQRPSIIPDSRDWVDLVPQRPGRFATLVAVGQTTPVANFAPMSSKEKKAADAAAKNAGNRNCRTAEECLQKGLEVLAAIEASRRKQDTSAELMSQFYRGYKRLSKILGPREVPGGTDDLSRKYAHYIPEDIASVVHVLSAYPQFAGLSADSFYTGLVAGYNPRKRKESYSSVSLYAPRFGLVVLLESFAALDLASPRSHGDVVVFSQYQQANALFRASSREPSTSRPQFVLAHNVINAAGVDVLESVFRGRRLAVDRWHEIPKNSDDYEMLLGMPTGEGVGRVLADFAVPMRPRTLGSISIMRDSAAKLHTFTTFVG